MNQTQHRRAFFLLPLLAACVVDSRWPRIETQQWPAPMQAVPGDLDSSALRGVVSSQPGVEEVLVLRYGDPVQVRPAGGAASYPLPFHDKEVQLNAGSWVLCSPGGKVEILWPGGTSIIFSGRTTGLVGSPSRGEPTFAFVELENATLDLRYGDQVRLLGGALISADVGPLALERLSSSIIRIENQSKADARIMFRDADFQLGPAEEIHLPLLSAGGVPWTGAFDGELRRKGVPLRWEGDSQVIPDEDGARIVPAGANELRGLGIRMQFDVGESLVVHGYEAPPVAPDEGEAPKEEVEVQEGVDPESCTPDGSVEEGAEQNSSGDGA